MMLAVAAFVGVLSGAVGLTGYSWHYTMALVASLVIVGLLQLRRAEHSLVYLIVIGLFVGYVGLSPELLSSDLVREQKWQIVLFTDAAYAVIGLIFALELGRKLPQIVFVRETISLNWLLFIAAIAAFSGVVVFTLNLRIVSFDQLFSLSRADLSQLINSSRGVLPTTPFFVIGFLSLFLFVIQMSKRSLVGWLAALACFIPILAYIVYLIAGGDRSAVVKFILPLVMLIFTKQKPQNLAMAVVVGSVLVMSLSALSYFRGPIREAVSSGDFAPIMARTHEVDISWFVPREWQAIPLSQVYVRQHENDMFGGGISLPTVLLAWLPRSISLGEAPPSMARYFGGKVGADMGLVDPYSVSFTVLAQSILHFGQLGALGFGFLLGAISNLFARIRFDRPPSFTLLLYLTCSPVILFVFRSSMGGIVTFTIYNVIILVALENIVLLARWLISKVRPIKPAIGHV